MRLRNTHHLGELRVRELAVSHVLVERHMLNMSYGHIAPQAKYVGRTIGPKAASRQNMPMGQSHFIRAWRKHRGLTQVQLAERVGINQGNLSKIESGARQYDQEFLEKAAEALKCEPADLIARDPADPDGIWALYDKMTAPQRAQATEVFKALMKVS